MKFIDLKTVRRCTGFWITNGETDLFGDRSIYVACEGMGSEIFQEFKSAEEGAFRELTPPEVAEVLTNMGRLEDGRLSWKWTS